MADLRTKSSSSNLIRFKLVNATTGAGLSGLTNSSGGLVISTICDVEGTATVYSAAGSTIQAIATLGAFAAPAAGSCRLSQVDAVNHPGLYEFQFADARFAVSGARRMVITVSGAANLLQADYEIQLPVLDIYNGVNGGMSAIPNASPGSNGGLPTANASNQVLALDGSGNALATASNLATASTNISAIETQANKIGTNSGDSPNQQTAQGTIATNLNATVSSRQAAGVAVTLPAPSGYGSTGVGSGSGPIAINQNTGGSDNLRYINSNGTGIGGANVLIYLATDWPGNPGNVQANATTGADGRWLEPAFVASGTYVAVFVLIGADGPDVSSPFTV